MRKLFTITSILGMMLLLMLPLQAQDEGSGVVVVGLTFGSENISTFNPLRCANDICTQIGDMLFPKVFAVDSDTGYFTPATAENGGLVEAWERSADGTQWTLTLHDGLTWSDGTPITAYDVFFSFIAVEDNNVSSSYASRLSAFIEGVVPLNDRQLIVLTKTQSCDALYGMQLSIVPAHVYDADFATTAADFFTGEGDYLEQWAAWDDMPYSMRYINDHPFETNPNVTYGDFIFDEWQRTDFVRLRSRSGDLVVEFRDTLSATENMHHFLDGDVTMLDHFDWDKWPDIANTPDVQAYEYTGLGWDSIVFNVADPFEPAPYRDAETGELLEQGKHPFFSDIRVRRAIQLGIDVDELIEQGLRGHGVPIYADQVPLSWAYDDSIPRMPYDREEAARLLDEAGWYLLAGNQRVCIRCTTAREGTRLAFGLNISGNIRHHWAVATVIIRQMRELGITVNIVGESGAIVDQRFDAALISRYETYPATPDRLQWFDPEEDILLDGRNYGSYYNPNLVALYEQARETCDLEERRQMYSEIARFLQSQQPYVWLYAYNEMVAVRGSVLNFEPRPDDPFWNLNQWIVWR